jgi:F-type H+-transporting ATPase subunit b
MDPKVIATEIPKVLTHIVGFVIAVLVLKRYAWGPILQLLEDRRAKIQGEFDRIEEVRAQVAELKAQYEAQLKEIEAQRRARVQEGVQEGRRISNEIQETARREKVDLMERTREEIDQEWAKAHVSLRNDMVAMVVQATERLLREKLDEARHRKLIEQYLSEIEAAGARSPR